VFILRCPWWGGGAVIPLERGIHAFFILIRFCEATPFLCANKERGERKSSPVAGVTSEFSCFLPCPVLIRIHAQQNRARRPWLALILIFKKH